jgi:hypothetical protein
MAWRVVLLCCSVCLSACASSSPVVSGAVVAASEEDALTDEDGDGHSVAEDSAVQPEAGPESAPELETTNNGVGGSTRIDCDRTGLELLPDVPNDIETNPGVFQRVLDLNDPMNEVQDLVHGIEITEENEGLDDYDWGADYGGISWDWERDMVLLFLTEGSTIDLAPLYAVFPGGRDDLRIEYVPYSYEQRATWRQTINRIDGGSNPIAAGMNEILNRLDIRAEVPDDVNLSAVLPTDAYCVFQFETGE